MTVEFSYSQVEKALMEINLVENSHLSRFRNRFKHFQKIDLFPKKTGKGNKISYDWRDILYISYVFELTQAGLQPGVIRKLIEFSYNGVESSLYEDIRYGDIYACYAGYFLMWEDDGPKSFGVFPYSRIGDFLNNCKTQRCILVNLSVMKQRLEASLGEIVIAELPVRQHWSCFPFQRSVSENS